ncbi:MAG: zinc ABC transporter substrate-binding protein, partial [Atopobium minutum]|nr:zinc ABC transporter substrate-binding protein [Atopobium minutum]
AQLATIADFVKKHQISTIFFEGKATPKVAETLAKSTGTKTATLYTMESLTEEEQQMGYLKLMEHNLDELVKSFSE